VRALLEAGGVQAGLLGTVTSIVGGVERRVRRTTPEAIDLQADFRAMLDAGDDACALAVSSHALALGRTEGIRFAAAVFTNLTQDHLDFHPTMEDYFQAKRSLFLPAGRGPGGSGAVADAGERASGLEPRPGVSVINVGDAHGRRLALEVGEGAVTFAVQRDADYRATNVRCDGEGCRFQAHTPDGEREVRLAMPGRFNVENALGALATAHALGRNLDTLVAALERGVRVPGRLEPVERGQEFGVLVDYAHTPDSLENVLRAVREIAGGRVVCVFGAGGDRDRGKRPLMGEIAARLADLVVVTSDNPRSESPEAIVAEIVAGIPRAEGTREAAGAQVRVEVDRRKAIEAAIASARAGDVVVIAGKGHEQGQEIAHGVTLPFDDRLVAEEVLSVRRAGAAGVGARR
jgi:UDP-N-acetylmuramoyl-L-alanyl-D-glutamate--2,6-diaminopimelate ligase